MLYEMTCNCGAKHAVSISQAGQSLLCNCGNSLEIPTLRGLKELPPVEPASRDNSRSIDRPTRSRPSIISGILVALFFLALPAAIFLAYLRLTLDTSQTEENERAAAFKIIDEGDAVLLSDTWAQFSTTALGPPSKPIFYYYEQRRKQLDLGILISSSIAVAAGLAAGAITAGKRTPAAR